jgi:hypothetical protein
MPGNVPPGFVGFGMSLPRRRIQRRTPSPVFAELRAVPNGVPARGGPASFRRDAAARPLAQQLPPAAAVTATAVSAGEPQHPLALAFRLAAMRRLADACSVRDHQGRVARARSWPGPA